MSIHDHTLMLFDVPLETTYGYEHPLAGKKCTMVMTTDHFSTLYEYLDPDSGDCVYSEWCDKDGDCGSSLDPTEESGF